MSIPPRFRGRVQASGQNVRRHIATLLLGTTLVLSGCDDKGNTYAPPPPPEVSIAHPEVRDVTRYLHLTGTTAAVESVALVARVPGFLTSINYRDGARVRKGDLLFVIEPDQYKAQLAQAEASITQAKAALANAEAQFDRQDRLVASQAAAVANVDTARADRDTARAQLEAAEANRQIAAINLGYTRITAPFDGAVTDHLADIGTLVGSGSPTTLATIVQLDPIHVVFTVSEIDLLRIRRQLRERQEKLADLGRIPVEIGTQIESGYPHRGTLDYVAPLVDAATGTLAARAILDNKNARLLPGLFVRIRIPVDVIKGALRVPDAAVGTDQQGSYVLVVDKDSVVRQRHIAISGGEDGFQIVTSGLSAEDRIVTGGIQRAVPGSKVAPQDAPSTAVSAAAEH